MKLSGVRVRHPFTERLPIRFAYAFRAYAVAILIHSNWVKRRTFKIDILRDSNPTVKHYFPISFLIKIRSLFRLAFSVLSFTRG